MRLASFYVSSYSRFDKLLLYPNRYANSRTISTMNKHCKATRFAVSLFLPGMAT